MEFNNQSVMDILALKEDVGDGIHLVSVPDGLGSAEERKQPGKISRATSQTMPAKVEELIEEINGSERRINCVIADQSLGWALEIAEKHGIKRVAFCPAANALLVLGFSIPKLIDEGVIDQDGTPVKSEMIKLSPDMPPMNTKNCVGLHWQHQCTKKRLQTHDQKQQIHQVNGLVALQLEPAAFTISPNIKPAPQSVIYVAFGSFTIFDAASKSSLSGLNSQAEHSFGCHCGWNSTIEDLSNGVPFLCWPYFADQFFNQSYICEYWGVGLGLERDGKGIIRRDEIRNKVKQVVGIDKYKATSMALMEILMNNIR
ncbi:hypothetical protein F3Y22_tig00110402pilonHSYRG00007 [Hibiscus syriacus]|uniref:UDP-glycosyltransferase 83A1-like n=1 Tax=Hibiscus syriacus TaxID=106335 RepID=A0A6A3ANP6_HIBSY|nr:hypothetical protein F3Y22_tig00110402pilonHSYRG00007 [Hibiscus syriacus]